MADDVLLTIARLLARARIRYALIGGHAVNVWLEPRFTADVDVTVEASPSDLERLRRVLAHDGFVAESEYGGELPSGPDFVRFVSSAEPEVTLEVQLAKTDFQRQVIARASAKGDESPHVATPEDLIVMKLIANRARDRIDLEGLVRLPSVDWAYVERWATAWDVLDALRRLRES